MDWCVETKVFLYKKYLICLSSKYYFSIGSNSLSDVRLTDNNSGIRILSDGILYKSSLYFFSDDLISAKITASKCETKSKDEITGKP